MRNAVSRAMSLPGAGNLRGAVFMMLSMAGFSTNDASFKLLAGEVPLFQGLVVRGIIVSCLIFALARWQGPVRIRLSRRDGRLMVLRCLGEVLGAFCFLTALFNMPLANASAILQSLPLAITLGAALLLGETVGWRRYMAIFVGLAGVLIIVRPGSDGFNAFSLLVVAAVLFITVRDITTRMLTPDLPALQVSLITAISVMGVAGLCSLFVDWQPVSAANWIALCASSVFLIGGYQFGVLAMRHGEVSVVAPFRYSLLIWATLLGWVIHDEIPDIWMLTGGAIVVASGLYTFYRERRVTGHRN